MQLKILNGEDAGMQVSFPEKKCDIGSSSSCEIILENPSVSEVHCNLVCLGPDWFINDKGSNTGTKVNDNKITSPTKIKAGDKIKIGEILLEVIDEKSKVINTNAQQIKSHQAQAVSNSQSQQIVHVKSKSKSEKECPFCYSVIPIKAVKCKYCCESFLLKSKSKSEKECPFCYSVVPIKAVKCKYCCESFLHDQQEFITNIAATERFSSFCWFLIGVLQVLAIITCIAGVWNIVNSVMLYRRVKRIEVRDSKIPNEYRKDLKGLILFFCVNLFLGAGIGVIFIAINYYVRKQILKHSYVFNQKHA